MDAETNAKVLVAVKIHYLHSPLCLNSNVPVENNALLEPRSMQPNHHMWSVFDKVLPQMFPTDRLEPVA